MFQQHGHLHEHSTGRPGERAFHGLHKYTIDVIRTYITKKTRKIPIHPQWSNDMTGKSVPRMCMVTRKFKSRMWNWCTTGTYLHLNFRNMRFHNTYGKHVISCSVRENSSETYVGRLWHQWNSLRFGLMEIRHNTLTMCEGSTKTIMGRKTHWEDRRPYHNHC